MLDRRHIDVKEERSSRADPLTDDEVRRMLAAADTVILARGKKQVRMAARDATLDDLRGPTGGFRAPLVRKGKTLLVGFSEEALEQLLG